MTGILNFAPDLNNCIMKIAKSRSLRLLILFLLFLAVHPLLRAQGGGVLQGKVSSDDGQPMIGVTITVVNEQSKSKQTSISGADGAFLVRGLQADALYNIQFSYVGYETRELTAIRPSDGASSTLDIKLMPGAATTGEEVVVVGYGRANKRDVTGAVKSVKASDFNRGIINTPQQLLQGKVAGVNVTSASGEPGAIQGITVRGPGGVRTSNTPLFVIDGLPLDNSATGGSVDPLSFLNPQDIESIDALKDASATAIYGSRGANGVVLITTRKGKAGFSSVNYNFSGGVSRIANKLPVFDAEEYKAQVTALGGTLDDFGGSTDWQDEITRTALTQNHNISLSGGSDKTTYFASFGLQDQEGILEGNKLKRYNGRVNLSQRALNDHLIIDVNLGASNVVNRRPNIGGLLGGALSVNPTIPARDENGNPTQFENGINPLTELALIKDISTTNRVVGNISGTVKIIKGLEYKLNFGIDNSTSTQDNQSLPNAVPLRTGSLSTVNLINRNHLIEQYLTYNGSTGNHRYTALAGHSYQQFYLQGRGNSINNFPIGGVEPIYNPGTGTELTLANNRPSGFATENELQSFFGRLNYAYADKYLFTATVRADGSTKFGDNNKYGTFPSFSAAWVLSKERFLENTPFNLLKLRAGWGATGNQEIPSKISLARFAVDNSAAASYPLFATGAYPVGIRYDRTANPNIQWEVSKQTDIGLDFELLKGKLFGTVDYFRKVTDNILLEVITPDPISPTATVWNNVDGMNITNQGVEVDLGYRNTSLSGFGYSVGGNITFITNKVEGSPYTVISSGTASGAGLTGANVNGYVNGEPIGTFYLQRFIGFNQDGLSQYEDANGDGLVNDGDRQALGSALPTKMYNFYGTADYKGFDLSVNFNGKAGSKIYDNTANSGFYKGLIAKGVNTTAEAVMYPEENINNTAPISSRFLKSGDFLRLNNLSLGYNFNMKSLGISDWIKGMRLSLTGQNLFVITPYNGYDPEVNTDRTVLGVLSYGIDYLSYPKARTFLLGFNLTF